MSRGPYGPVFNSIVLGYETNTVPPFLYVGMSEKHMQTEKYSVSEYARAQRRLHKQILREQQKAAGIAGRRVTRQVSNQAAILEDLAKH